MYSRFDIIWPDDRSTDESNSGVDALTFGLATLVMGEELFNGEWPDARAERGSHALSPCPTCSTTRWHQNQRQGEQSVWYPGSGGNRWRKGNHYARYTRKFSISNGPEHMVSDYLITKDSGKMLGTLVALAIARMPMLESFIWDMRTGVLRDVWLALSSLGDRPSEGNCRLKHIWLRCHDNSLVPVARRPVSTISTPGRMQASAPAQTLASTGPTRSRASIDRPSFSILPPLESLSVVDIDELAYLDEMSMLIERSQPRLRELRVGIAFEARDRDWAMSLTGDDLVQVDNSVTWQNSNAAGSRRLAGPLGVLVSRIYDINDKRSCLGLATANPPIETHAKTDSLSNGSPMIGVGDTAIAPSSLEVPGTAASQPPAHTATEGSTAHGYQAAQIPQPSFAENPNDIGLATLGQEFELAKIHNGNAATQGVTHGSTETQSKVANTALLRVRSLRLDLLELERVPLFIPVMLRAFDWRFLTSLTILNCPNHERLWGSLRRACRPIHSVVARASSSLKINSESAPSSHMLDYPLKLKKLWTNTVSSALMTFLRDTLAPDSLEVLFLQEAYDYKSEVTIDSICRGPIKRHRRSLKKLLIDSVERSRAGPVIGGRRWRRWMLSDEHLAFVLNSKMSSLRELSIALDGKDWVSDFKCPLPPPFSTIATCPHGNTACLLAKASLDFPSSLPIYKQYNESFPHALWRIRIERDGVAST